jgi:peptidylprolyl isomerase
MSDPGPAKEETVEQVTMPAGDAAAAGTKGSAPDVGAQKKHTSMLILAGVAVVVIVAATGAYFLLSGPVATTGDTVAVYYNESFENGTVYISNMNTTYPPLTFTIGNSSVIDGVQNAVIGMSPGEIKTVTIPYTEAYGAYDPGLVQTLNRTGPIANMTFEPGQTFTVHYKATNSFSDVKILNVTEKTITWDANNPLAGYNLTFTIKLANITQANTTPAAA